MILTDILSSERVRVAARGTGVQSKDEALRALAALLGAGGTAPGEADFYRVLVEREALQSTGIGDGVAIPHGALENLPGQVAALLICPGGSFDAIDGGPVFIMFAVLTPKRHGEREDPARISRLLRTSFRQKLWPRRSTAHGLIVSGAEEGRAADRRVKRAVGAQPRHDCAFPLEFWQDARRG
jgi:PTS system nitrogen regulatory IIA component